jgi:hypothetical protein
MYLPGFLVIGAMKCGTTTLYRDLLAHPDVFLPDKELNFLSREAAGAPDAARRYGLLFGRARPDQLCGDVSTEYSMLPDVSGVAQRAKRLLASETRIVYLVREPVSRAISHHRHMACWPGEGRMSIDINDSVRRHASIIDYGRYMMQLEPWREAFGEGAIRVVVFEQYIRNRKQTIESLCRFLGLSPRTESVEEGTIHNQSDNKPVLNRFWLRVHNSVLYRRLIRPTIPPALKEGLGKLLLPKAPRRPTPPTPATVHYIIERVQEDVDQLTRLLDCKHPIWDLDAVAARFGVSPVARAA